MEYPLSPVPLSVATTEGRRCTIAKSKLLDIINTTLSVPSNGPKLVISIDTTRPSALIVDLITAIKAMTKIPERYKQLAWKFLAALPKGYYRIDLVADTYRDISIKSCQRFDCGTSTQIMISSLLQEYQASFQSL